MPTVAHRARMVTIAAIVAVPLTECVACRNISMNGYPVLVLRAALRSPMQNNSATIIANPMMPFSTILSMMERGTTTEGLRISSDIWSLS